MDLIKNKIFKGSLLICLLFLGCSKSGNNSRNNPVFPPPVTPPVPTTPGISYWLTTGDKTNLLTNRTTGSGFGTVSNSSVTITVDSAQQFQTVDGFGYTLTQGSALVISQLPAAQRNLLLNEIFGSSGNSLGISYLRIGIGATDLSSSVYTYDDMPAGQTDPALASFSISPDLPEMIPILKQILLINPGIKLLATPWSAPSWMKDNNSSIGGNLKPVYYQVYADYFVKYIHAMQAEGLPIHAITLQNEPLNPGNNPSMFMSATQQATFIKNNLGPAFSAAGISTKIIIYDHNCDLPGYPLEILNDPAARQYVDGSAFHLYAGDISAMLQVYNAYPDKNVYFTEQYTSSAGNFAGDLQWHIKNVIIGSMRNRSKIALEWNLANDPSFGPHTPGGCTTCLGALTVEPASYARNVAYYIIAHASRFVPAGSKRIASDNSGSIISVAFLRPDGKKVLIVLNDSNSEQSFHIKFKSNSVITSLQGGATATYVW